MQVWQRGKAKYIFFLFLLFCFSGTKQEKLKQTFSSYCKWSDYQITFIVTKFQKKKKEGTKKAN